MEYKCLNKSVTETQAYMPTDIQTKRFIEELRS